MADEIRFFELYYDINNAKENKDEVEQAVLNEWPDDNLHEVGVNSSGELFIHGWVSCSGISPKEGVSALFEHFGRLSESSIL